MLTFLKNILNNKNIKAFTLIETMVGLTVIVTTVLGPLSVAVTSSSYSRNTKNQITAMYLAEEASEILRFRRDTVLNQCLNGDCISQEILGNPGVYENPSETAWMKFKKEAENVSTCFLISGCAYDLTLRSRDLKYSSEDCDYLWKDYTDIAESSGIYLCYGSLTGDTSNFKKTIFSRVVKLTKILPTSPLPVSVYDLNYKDDIRVDITVSYLSGNGFERKVKIVDFLHAKS